MVLGEQSISGRGLIIGGNASSFRDGSYDLTIGEFATSQGKVDGEFVLPAQGIVKVISRETIRVPPDVIGYVLVKTGLCNEGVLSLNIGIVDPGFEGPLQSALINFGKAEIRLRCGDVFSRISFHLLDAPRSRPLPSPLVLDNVRKDVQQHVDRFLAPTFLDIAKTAEVAAEKAFEDYKSAMFKWLPLLALFIAALTFLLNFGNMWILYSYMKPQDQVRTETLWREADERIKKLEADNAALRQLVPPSVPARATAPSQAGSSLGRPSKP
jgi:dUTPase